MFYAVSFETSVKLTWTIQMGSGTIPFAVSRAPNPPTSAFHSRHVGLTVSIFQSLHTHVPIFQLPSGFRRPVDDRFSFIPVRNTQAGGRQSANRLASLSGRR